MEDAAALLSPANSDPLIQHHLRKAASTSDSPHSPLLLSVPQAAKGTGDGAAPL